MEEYKRESDTSSRSYRWKQTVWKGILAGFAVLSFFQAYHSLVPLGQQSVYFGLVCMMGGLLLCCVASLAVGVERYASWIPALLALILTAGRLGRMYQGFLATLNYFIGWWNLKYRDGMIMFQVTGVSEQDILLFAVAVLLLAEALVWSLLYRGQTVRLGILLLAAMVPGVIFGRFSAAAFACMSIAGAGIWMFQLHEQANMRRALWLVGFGSVFLAAALIFGNQDIRQVASFRAEAVRWTEKVRFGEDSLPLGDIYKADRMHDGNEPRLSVTAEQAKTLYFRGFTGARYEKGQWSPLPKSVYGGARNGMLAWLRNRGFTPSFQYASYRSAGAGGAQPGRIDVTNIGARRNYIYIPYSTELLWGSRYRTSQDNGLVSANLFGTGQYSLEERSESVPAELLHIDNWIHEPGTEEQQQYVQQENIYRDFVYENYLQTDRKSEPLVRELLLDEKQHGIPESIYMAAVRIRKGMETYMTYGEHPQKPPEGTDPLYWFLASDRVGNDALYATATVEAFRICGIPARYAEGYVLKESRAVSAGGGAAELTDQDSHAWCEVYMDGAGWVPVDVVPGYYYDTYAMIQLLKYPKGVQQTSAEENSEKEAEQILKEKDGTEGKKENYPQNPALDICLGIWTALLVLGGVLVCMAELIQVLLKMNIRHRYETAGPEERDEFLCRFIAEMLEAVGIEIHPGWKNRETEERLRERFPVLRQGEYMRVSQVMEQFLYGNHQLLEFEKRVLTDFIEKILWSPGKLSRRDSLRLRYCWILICVRKIKLTFKGNLI